MRHADTRQNRWAMILAGGDGVRLRSLTRRITGDERPKQFCPVIGGRTLLEQTWRRAALAVPAERTLVVVTRAHERFYTAILPDLGARHVVVQPQNRGTTTSILYPLLRLAAMAPDAVVAILPSDHHFSDDTRFMGHVDAAFETLETCPQRTLLLGITPDTSESEYGWIEPGESLAGAGPAAPYTVRRFWEKPEPALAEMLRDRGCLWNSFVMVARVSALLGLVRSAVPDLYDAFARIRGDLGGASETGAVDSLYARLAPSDFSREILSERPGALGVLPVRGVTWSDLGSPVRVLLTRHRMDRMATLTAAS